MRHQRWLVKHKIQRLASGRGLEPKKRFSFCDLQLFFAILLSKIACQAPAPSKKSSNCNVINNLLAQRKVRISYVPIAKIDIERQIRSFAFLEKPDSELGPATSRA
jgi:hypothetical protein